MSILQTLQVRIVDEAERLGPAELVVGTSDWTAAQTCDGHEN